MTIILLIINGRQTHSIGVSLREFQDTLYKEVTLNVVAVDCGSSAILYFGRKVRTDIALRHE